MALLGLVPGTAAQAATAPFSQCPAVGASTGCSLLITLNADGTQTIEADTAQPPYDGSASSLVGIQNNSGRTLRSLTLNAGNDIGGGFAFANNGPCQYVPAPSQCGTSGFGGSTGYSGPGNNFSAINGAATQGTINLLGGGLSTGASTWFALAQDLTAAQVSVASAPVFVGGSGYHPLVPARALDTRSGGGAGPIVAGTPRNLTVTGVGGVPSSATAVVLSIAATDGTAGSYLTVWPAGGAPSEASNLNFAPGQTIANLTTTSIGAGGAVSIANAVGSTHVVVDVVGYYDDGEGPGDLYNGITPARALDSRTPSPGWPDKLSAGTTRNLTVAGGGSAGAIPASATAVIANVTVTESTAPAYVTVWPAGAPQPGTSNINFLANQTIAVAAIVKVGSGGAISFATSGGSVHVIVDVEGYFDPTGGGKFHALPPTRHLDSRINRGVTGPWQANQSRSVTVAGTVGIASDATGVVTNLTATNGSAPTYETVFPTGAAQPTASNLNVSMGDTIANLVIVKTGTAGAISIYNAQGTVQLIGDAAGFYAAT